jgi:hypothetical protein
MGFEVFNASRTGNLSFTPTMLYVGPTVSYSGAFGQISGLEAGLDARILIGVENLSFNLFGRRFMLALWLRGQAMYSSSLPRNSRRGSLRRSTSSM